MDHLKVNYICAFCTTTTNNNGAGYLEKFNCEFISNPLFQLNCNSENILRDNWSICDNCLPQLQLLLKSKQKVDRVDSEVRYLQNRLLTEIKCLSEEVDKMFGELVMIEGILRGNPVTPTPSKRICVKKKKRGRKPTKLTSERDLMMVQFREKIFNVLQDIQTFRVEISNKLLLKNKSDLSKISDRFPPIKIEVEDEPDMVTSENNYVSSPPTSPPPSSDEEIPEDYDDFEFDPSQSTSVKLNKNISNYSKFRRDIIARIRDHSTISTSPHLPSSKDDPRRPYFIKYYSVTNTFKLNDIQFNCLDTLKTLQCSKCSYTTNYSNDNQGHHKDNRNVEDWIFDHILSKHLNAYNCKLCGVGCRSWYKLTVHLRSHEKEFSCDICEKPLATKGGVRVHKWTHLSEEEKKMAEYQDWKPSGVKYGEKRGDNCGRSFQCETCGKGFKQKNILKAHEIVHVDPGERERVMCTDCGKQVFLKCLKSHQGKWCEKVRGARRGLDCKVCGENWRTLKMLHEHLRERHPGEKVWGCEVCGRKFKTKFDLRKHEVLHGEEKRFLCGRCGRGFKQKKNCQRHEGTCGRGGGGGEGALGEEGGKGGIL